MDYKLYKPSELEKNISLLYQSSHIKYASDLCINRVADLFQIELRLYEGKPFACWDDGYFSFIFLNAFMDDFEMREVFFHELCHPIQHEGNQKAIPLLMRQLQENQAKQFELYAAMPFYLLEPFFETTYYTQDYTYFIGTLSEEFQLSIPFIKKRLVQIQSNIISQTEKVAYCVYY